MPSPKAKKNGNHSCGHPGPGPIYVLKTVVGYKDHCISKYRNPAFTIGKEVKRSDVCDGPGPKYLFEDRRKDGFSIGHKPKINDLSCGPGPKYLLPDGWRGPAFSMRFRIPEKPGCPSAGPYDLRTPPSGPAFSIVGRGPIVKCQPSPGPRNPYNLDVMKPRAPAFTIMNRVPTPIKSDGPGPIYYVPPPKPVPMFSFGMKHTECSRPYITPCDDQC